MADFSIIQGVDWRAHPVHPYDVSSRGEVRSRKTGRVLRPYLMKVGYRAVGIYDGHQMVPHYVHRLVAETFLGPPQPGQEVRHLDGDKEHNSVSNLAWGTRHENIQDMLAHGGHQWASRNHCSRGHEYTPENTRGRSDRPGARVCRQCEREWYHERKARA